MFAFCRLYARILQRRIGAVNLLSRPPIQLSLTIFVLYFLVAILLSFFLFTSLLLLLVVVVNLDDFWLVRRRRPSSLETTSVSRSNEQQTDETDICKTGAPSRPGRTSGSRQGSHLRG